MPHDEAERFEGLSYTCWLCRPASGSCGVQANRQAMPRAYQARPGQPLCSRTTQKGAVRKKDEDGMKTSTVHRAVRRPTSNESRAQAHWIRGSAAHAIRSNHAPMFTKWRFKP